MNIPSSRLRRSALTIIGAVATAALLTGCNQLTLEEAQAAPHRVVETGHDFWEGESWSYIGPDGRESALTEDFGIARQALTAEEAAELPDLYSPSLTSDSSYSWDNGDYAFRLNADRIVPLNQIVKLGGAAWSIEKKQAFGSDIDNLSPTSHAANGWKGLKTPAGLAEDQKAGTFSWTDSCAEVYKDLAVLTPVGGCVGVPEDFDSCGYAERYREIAARYELKIPKEDRDALDSLSAECPKN